MRPCVEVRIRTLNAAGLRTVIVTWVELDLRQRVLEVDLARLGDGRKDDRDGEGENEWREAS